jgi:hypothetical protein
MSEGVDELFILDHEGALLRSVPLRPMRLEDRLQKLLEMPGIIPGSQIDPANPDPPRFALLRREMPVGDWSLDHLYVDQFGVLTLLEAKLLQNPESRRAVVGQIIEYAANARGRWASGMARQHAAKYWSTRGEDLDDVLRSVFPNLDLDQLWRDVESNLELGNIRLIIAADSIHPEVRRMIEYLNSEMKNVTVLGLELRVYGEEQGQMILAPRIIGQTQVLADSRPRGTLSILWDESKLREAFGVMPDQEASPLIALLEWSLKNECFLGSQAASPTFGLMGLSGYRLFSVNSAGTIYLWFEEPRYPNGSIDRDRLVNELKILGWIGDEDPAAVKSGRYLTKSLFDLHQNNHFDLLLEILGRYCRVSNESA